MELVSEREVREMLGPDLQAKMDAGEFPQPAQVGPRGRFWWRGAVEQWALKNQVGQTQTRPAESGVTRPAE